MQSETLAATAEHAVARLHLRVVGIAMARTWPGRMRSSANSIRPGVA
jgi:hypothetical protein